jgi:hypothetical protein
MYTLYIVLAAVFVVSLVVLVVILKRPKMHLKRNMTDIEDLEQGPFTLKSESLNDDQLDLVLHNIYRTYDFQDPCPVYSHRSNVYRYKVNQGLDQFLIRYNSEFL